MIDLVALMQTLSHKRPVFHSEADFQHALAWEIHLQLPTWEVRLEHPSSIDSDQKGHLDVLLFGNGQEIAIELKYKTAPFFAPIKREIFLLKGHSAQDIGRYDFLRDVQRLERAILEERAAVGYATLLTNDSLYWNPSGRNLTISDSFRLTEGRRVAGTLAWGPNAGKGTTKNRESPILLKGMYDCVWRDYSNMEHSEYAKGSKKFRYLIFEVTKTGHGS